MLTNREKRLLNLLFAVIIIGTSVLFIIFRSDDLSVINSNIENMEKNLALTSIAEMDANELKARTEEVSSTLEKVKNKFYSPGEINLDDFSRQVETLAKSMGLTYKSTRMGSSKEREYVDFDFTGNALALSRFLKAVNTGEKYWRFLDFTVKNNRFNNGRTLDINLRISYETLGSENH